MFVEKGAFWFISIYNLKHLWAITYYCCRKNSFFFFQALTDEVRDVNELQLNLNGFIAFKFANTKSVLISYLRSMLTLLKEVLVQGYMKGQSPAKLRFCVCQ